MNTLNKNLLGNNQKALAMVRGHSAGAVTERNDMSREVTYKYAPAHQKRNVLNRVSLRFLFVCRSEREPSLQIINGENVG